MGKIPTYTALTAPNNNDLLVIEDSVSSSTKKITRENFLKGTALPADTVTTVAIQTGAVNASKIDSSTSTFVRVARSTTQSLPNNTTTAVVFNVEGDDTLSEYDNSTGIFTASVAMNVNVHTALRIQGAIAGSNALRVIIQWASAADPTNWQSRYEENRIAPPAFDTVQTSGGLKLEAGDKVRVAAIQNSGSSQTIDSNTQNVYMSITRAL